MPSRIFNERAVGHLVDPDEVETINVLGATIQFLTPPESENAPCIMRGSIPPAGFVPMHSHADPETFMLLSGSVEGLVYRGRELQVGSNQSTGCLLRPRGCEARVAQSRT